MSMQFYEYQPNGVAVAEQQKHYVTVGFDTKTNEAFVPAGMHPEGELTVGAIALFTPSLRLEDFNDQLFVPAHWMREELWDDVDMLRVLEQMENLVWKRRKMMGNHPWWCGHLQ